MSEASERLSGSTWDVETLLTDALRPIEPPERLSGRFEDTLSRGHPGRRRGALRLGRGALRERAAGAARPAQLGAARWSRSAPAASPPAPWSCSSCAAAAAAKSESGLRSLAGGLRSRL